MNINKKRIGFVLTGSFCAFPKVMLKIKELIKNEAEIIPIMSYNSYNIDTKYGKATDIIKELENLTNKKVIHTLQDAEMLGKKIKTDVMIIAPCSRKYNIKISV